MTAFALHLLRHGVPERAGRFLGHGDHAPTPEGIAACVDRTSGLDDIEAVVTSDLSRARRAAEAIGGSIGRTPVIDPRWRELDFGAWDGLPSGDIDAEALGRFWDDPDAYPPPGGERWAALCGRVGAALRGLAPRPTLVVTHGGAMRAALAILCGFEQRRLWAFDLPCASLLSLSVQPGDRPTGQITGLRS